MSYVLALPSSSASASASSPSPRDPAEEDSAHAAHLNHPPSSSSFSPGPHPHHPHPHTQNTPHTSLDSHDMAREKVDKGPPAVDIVVASDTLVLRGTGVDVNPALMSGNVVLYLSEPTAIREITLQFRGKAKIPPAANESLALNASPLTYVVCNHEWSFLEGTRSHAHTLKAGRHLFPFQLNIGGSLPSSINTSALGGASVHYKLRASVIRPGFALGLTHRELTAIQPIHILRGFSSEALEYQQTLEIENTWPEKLMYSIMIPHKAWPAGDRVTAVVKFSPLVKGARVQSVTTSINETVKLHTRGGIQENSRAIATAKHEIVDGHAVCVDERHHRYRIPLLHQSPTMRSSNPSPPHHATSSSLSHSQPSAVQSSPAELSPLTTVTTNSSASSGSHGREPSSAHVALPPRSQDIAGPSDRTITPNVFAQGSLPQEIEDEPSSDVVTTLHILIPTHATPGHALEPIQVTHRIRWSIMIANKDGHVSELRCSLPLHILDHRLFEEAHAATLATRRLLLGARDVDGGQAVGIHGDADEEEEDSELPSYPAHVRDRVANAFLPETATMRVTNPWVAHGISPVVQRSSVLSEGSSGMQSPAPMEVHPFPAPHGPDARSQLPANPSPDALHWVTSELLLSLSQQPETRAQHRTRRSPSEHTPPPEPDSAGSSRHGSRFPSRRGSRANSRSGSPERGSSDVSRAQTIIVGPDKTYVHNSSSASRSHHGLFHMSMKPFTSLTSGFGLGHRTSSHHNLASPTSTHGPSGLSSMSAARHSATDVSRLSGTSTPSSSGVNTPALGSATPPNLTEDQLLLHRAFIETPDYEIASRGFLGGGIPPLSSFAGLPSYEEAAGARGMERSMSDTDLAGRMGAMHMSGIHQRQLQHQTNASTAPPSPPRRSTDL